MTTNCTHFFKSFACLIILFTCMHTGNAQQAHHISVENNFFDPASLTIATGDTVIWTNSSGFHNVNGTQAEYPSNPESFGNSTGEDWTYSFVFTSPGTYDYHCDPHVDLGMTGEITVIDRADITVNFSDMDPHVGQDLWMAVIDQETGEEVGRVKKVVETSFSLEVAGVDTDKAYNIDFYADLNENGSYDAPPDDHAWRLQIDDLQGDSTLDFAHNTDFTDIEWQHKLTVDFSDMGPHVDQDLWLAVINKNSGEEIARVNTVVESEFSLSAWGIETGESYMIDFFADFNENGSYDAPGDDHAWRMDLDNVVGDTTLTFTHNTDFTDIEWQHIIQLNLSGMDPHVGQDLWVAVIDQDSGDEIARMRTTVEAEYTIEIPGIIPGNNYNVDFFADFNENGNYDAPPDDHVWRMTVENAESLNILDFVHNTDFTDVEWQHKLTVDFSGMDPHVDQDLWLAVINKNSGDEIARVNTVVKSEFSLSAWGIETGESYRIDFFADFNENGSYDAPGDDHAWRMDLDNVVGDTTLAFAHNTDFTDIGWEHKLTLAFLDMAPHVDQLFELYLYNLTSEMYVDTIIVDPIQASNYELVSYDIVPGNSYNIDFFADFNENGSYDAPPDDHAWRMMLEDVAGDTTLEFTHNTDFTDIFESDEPDAVNNDQFTETIQVYPNPAVDHVNISLHEVSGNLLNIRITNMNGQVVKSKQLSNPSKSVRMNVSELPDGFYLLEIRSEELSAKSKLMITQ